jgi:hypothetical protein
MENTKTATTYTVINDQNGRVVAENCATIADAMAEIPDGRHVLERFLVVSASDAEILLAGRECTTRRHADGVTRIVSLHE